MSYVVAILLVLGMFFAFVAALGVVRMPDFFIRLHAATKAGAFGSTLILLAAALHFGSLRAFVMALLTVVFFYLTTPVAAQVLGESAHRRRVRLWEKTQVDQLRADEEAASQVRGE